MAIARSVAIIGGGIGGLTLANALLRTGMSVSLYEKAPHYIPIAGAGFGFQPNGQISLAYIGFQDAVEKILHPFFKWQLLGSDGKAISTSHRLSEFGDRLGYFVGGAIRAELVDLLKAPLENNHIIHYSHKVVDIEQDVDGVTISFENGAQQKPVRVDMVVGADGIHSTVVEKVFPRTPPPIYSKENIFYGIIENIDRQSSINPIITQKNTLTQCLDLGEFISCRSGNQGKFMWAATYSSDAPPPASGDTEWTHMNTQRELTRFLALFPSSHPVHRCAAATEKERLLHFGLYYRAHRSDSWHRGRVCLLGDACHATLPYVGQGANMAIEDAIALTIYLEKHQFQMEPAFQEYYKSRYRRTKLAVDTARRMGSFLHSQNPIVGAMRRHLLPRMMSSSLMIRVAEKELFENCCVPLEYKKIVK